MVNSNGTETFWSNDDSGVSGREPATAVSAFVEKGLYSVALGDTRLLNMLPIPPTVFTNTDVRLRVWFSDGKNGFQQLSPDQRITAVGYAMIAAGVTDGSITTGKLADQSVTTEKLARGAITTAQLSNGAVGAAQLANGAVGSAQLADGAVGISQLAPGSALANLLASGQSGVASGGIVLALNGNSAAMASAGYVNIGALPFGTEWQTLSTGPARRFGHTAVWTGTEMLIWGGGAAGVFLNDGGRYNPATDTWRPITTAGAPEGRWYHRAVWTGSEMLVWGGRANFRSDVANKKNGGRYNPIADTWRPITETGAPPPRCEFVAVWSGTEMLVWGGVTDGSSNPIQGGRYNPASDTWTPITTNGAPGSHYNPAGVWTGSEMIVWGGGDVTGVTSANHLTMAGATIQPRIGGPHCQRRAPHLRRLSQEWRGPALK